MEYMTTEQAAEKWGISDRRARLLCGRARIDGAHKEGRSYLVPADAAKPSDGRRRGDSVVPQEYAVIYGTVAS